MSKKTIIFDFDGVIHLGYEGWKDGSIYGTINWRLLDYIEELLEDYYVVISTNRPAQQIVDYFDNIKEHVEPLKFEVFKKDMNENMYWNKDNVIGVTNEKAVGILYVDDRGFKYDNSKDTDENIYLIDKILGRKSDVIKELDLISKDKIRKLLETERIKALDRFDNKLGVKQRIYKRNVQVALIDKLKKELLEE